MTRSKGDFPSYSKLDLDPEKWPEGYWDSSLRCRKCERLWPNINLFKKSPCCNFATLVVEQPPDMRWPEAVYEFLEYRFENLYDKWNEGKSDEELLWEDIKTNGELDTKKVSEAIDEVIAVSNVRTLK